VHSSGSQYAPNGTLRSQFGDKHKAIKDFFPNSQLFGFTDTPIFEQNATVKQIDGEEASYKTTEGIFQQALHKYTISHTIEDRNVLKFHIDYFKPEVGNDKPAPKPGERYAHRAIVANLLKMQRWVTWLLHPQSVILPRQLQSLAPLEPRVHLSSQKPHPPQVAHPMPPRDAQLTYPSAPILGIAATFDHIERLVESRRHLR